jgi:chromosome segregation ATPase
MKKILFPIIALTILMSATNSCNSSLENVENAETEVDAANKELQLAKEALAIDIANYKSEMNKQINENKTIIANLKVDLEKQSKMIQAARESKITELELKNAEMETKINNYNADDKDNWEKFKVEFNQDMNAMKEAIQGLNAVN